MNMFQNFKRVQAIRPQVLDGATAASYVIDLAGATECNIVLSVGATDAAITALKLQESDTKTDATTLATGTDCTGLVFGTSADPLTGSTSVTPTATSDPISLSSSTSVAFTAPSVAARIPIFAVSPANRFPTSMCGGLGYGADHRI